MNQQVFSEAFGRIPDNLQRPVYRHPDGELFEIARMADGIVETTTGRRIPESEWARAERVG